MFFDFLRAFGMFLSLAMCIFLFVYVYVEGIKISNAESKVRAGTFLTSVTMALIFGFIANSFY